MKDTPIDMKHEQRRKLIKLKPQEELLLEWKEFDIFRRPIDMIKFEMAEKQYLLKPVEDGVLVERIK